MSKRKARILTAKMGLDCHDTGIVTIANMLRDAGYEVIYLGLHNSVEEIIQAAIDEDVQVIGLSFLSGQHLTQVNKLMESIHQKGEDFKVIIGGVIPKTDIPKLEAMGVRKVFTPGTMVADIDAYISQIV
ncbi:MAG: methylmalonyl-CoA mutase [Desulfosporosinus sp. BRH_c37]|nr:MAG: methylmalonyl-CoA mutase [Desulfosporosinus sp. BRH_c37]